MMAIVNVTRSAVLAESVGVANTFFSRLKGLLGRKSLNTREALIIKPAKGIHTFFMAFPIDVVFVGSDNKVVSIQEDIPPFRMTAFFPAASFVIELPAGAIRSTQTQQGDSIRIDP